MAVKKKLPKTSGKKTSDHIRLDEQVWPLERDVLFRPDRLKYVRRIIRPAGCVFCESAKSVESFETLCVYKSNHSMIMLNKFPYNGGHLLILPLRHCGDLLKFSDEEYDDLQQLVRIAVRAVQTVYAPGGMNIGLNHGAVAGAGIPDHLHYHIVPRWSGDLNFFPVIAETKVVIESLDQTYKKYREYFQGKGQTE